MRGSIRNLPIRSVFVFVLRLRRTERLDPGFLLVRRGERGRTLHRNRFGERDPHRIQRSGTDRRHLRKLLRQQRGVHRIVIDRLGGRFRPRQGRVGFYGLVPGVGDAQRRNGQRRLYRHDQIGIVGRKFFVVFILFVFQRRWRRRRRMGKRFGHYRRFRYQAG